MRNTGEEMLLFLCVLAGFLILDYQILFPMGIVYVGIVFFLVWGAKILIRP